MFNIGDLIVYGNTGVCTVDSVGFADFPGADKNKEYYGLTPYYSGRSRIFIPCGCSKVVMRDIVSREEAESILNDIASIDMIKVEEEKNREQVYKDTIRGCDCREIIGLIKTIVHRKKTRQAEGKKITSSDEKYFLIAEDKLYGEFAIALNTSKEKVKALIKEQI